MVLLVRMPLRQAGRLHRRLSLAVLTLRYTRKSKSLGIGVPCYRHPVQTLADIVCLV